MIIKSRSLILLLTANLVLIFQLQAISTTPKSKLLCGIKIATGSLMILGYCYISKFNEIITLDHNGNINRKNTPNWILGIAMCGSGIGCIGSGCEDIYAIYKEKSIKHA